MARMSFATRSSIPKASNNKIIRIISSNVGSPRHNKMQKLKTLSIFFCGGQARVTICPEISKHIGLFIVDMTRMGINVPPD